jgi:hypothetical protein
MMPLELESLSAKPALMQVVSLQIINMMTQEMYQGDRGLTACVSKPISSTVSFPSSILE